MLKIDSINSLFVDWEELERYLYIKSAIHNLIISRNTSISCNDTMCFIKQLKLEDIEYNSIYFKKG